MPSINKAIIVGHLGRDPDTKYMPGGDAVCNFTVATSEQWTKDGEKRERTEWHRCTAYRKLGEICGEYLKKGSLVYIEGKLQTREWTDKDGNKRYTTEIVVSEMKMLGGKSGGSSGEPDKSEPQTPRDTAMKAIVDLDNDIPF